MVSRIPALRKRSEGSMYSERIRMALAAGLCKNSGFKNGTGGISESFVLAMPYCNFGRLSTTPIHDDHYGRAARSPLSEPYSASCGSSFRTSSDIHRPSFVLHVDAPALETPPNALDP